MAMDFNLTSDNLVTSALRVAGILRPGQTASNTQLSTGRENLNVLIKSWMADGLQLWVTKQHEIPMTNATISYTLGPTGTVVMDRPLRISQVLYRNTSGNDRELNILSKAEYNQLSDKDTKAVPNSIYYDPALTNGVLYVWPVQETVTTETIHITYQKPFEDLDSGSDDFEFPQEWYRALKYSLAVELCPEYNVNPAIWDRLQMIAANEYAKVISWDTENTSMYLQPSEMFRWNG